MKERDITQKVKEICARTEVVERLGIGTRSGRWVKIPDSWAQTGDGKRFIPFKGTDLVWATDCLEVKVVKAKTEKGLVFHVEQLNEKQRDHLIQHDGLVAVGFIMVGEKTDRHISTVIFRYGLLSALKATSWTRFDLEGLALMMPDSVYVEKGPAYEVIAS